MISSTAAYALRAVVFLANRPNDYLSRSEISEGTLVPHDYLLKVLRQLADAEIVTSKRGPGGGYRLTTSPDELTSLAVVSAVDTIPRIKQCPLGIIEHQQLCPLHRLLDDASRAVEEAFQQTMITDLLPRKRSRTCNFPND